MRKVYLFNNTQQPGFGDCYSITDDGVILGNHICSHSFYMEGDLYLRPDRKEKIDNYFKEEPYEVEIIKDEEVKTHEGLKKAWELNQKRGEEARQFEKAGVTIEVAD